jgi:hypothetical protein
MIDVSEDLKRFDCDYDPTPADGRQLRRPGIDTLPDGDADFRVVDAVTDRTGKDRDGDPVLRIGLQVLSGPAAGETVEWTQWLNNQIGVNILGTALLTLGLDADQWKLPQRPFSAELMKALPKLPGRCFRGHVKTNGKYKNLYVNFAISGTAAPMPTPPADEAVFAGPAANPNDDPPF